MQQIVDQLDARARTGYVFGIVQLRLRGKVLGFRKVLALKKCNKKIMKRLIRNSKYAVCRLHKKLGINKNKVRW